MRKVSAIMALLLGLILVGCTVPEKGVSTKPSSQTTAEVGTESGGEDGDSNVTQIGQWATAEDGIAFRAAKLKRGRVASISAGGHPGDPAVVVTVQFRNEGNLRFDLTLVDVKVRLGKDGAEAEQVFQDGFDGGFDGTLAPGRAVSEKYIFAASKASDLKEVSVEITPGMEYDSATFEGGA